MKSHTSSSSSPGTTLTIAGDYMVFSTSHMCSVTLTRQRSAHYVLLELLQPAPSDPSQLNRSQYSRLLQVLYLKRLNTFIANQSFKMEGKNLPSMEKQSYYMVKLDINKGYLHVLVDLHYRDLASFVWNDPVICNWSYKVKDDCYLTTNHLKRLAFPLMLMGGIPSYHSQTSQSYTYAFWHKLFGTIAALTDDGLNL
ncbi:hypothetical protein ACTFIV_005199 [Dictyostelium citrinum]